MAVVRCHCREHALLTLIDMDKHERNYTLEFALLVIAILLAAVAVGVFYIKY